MVRSTPTSPSRICRVILWDSTSVESAGSNPKGWTAVPKLKVAVGWAGLALLGEPEEACGAGSAVQDVTPNAIRTAPVLMTVRRDVLLGNRLSPLDFAGAAGCGPEPSLIDAAGHSRAPAPG